MLLFYDFWGRGGGQVVSEVGLEAAATANCNSLTAHWGRISPHYTTAERIALTANELLSQVQGSSTGAQSPYTAWDQDA